MKVRAPPNKDFAFVEFRTHSQAQAAIDSRGEGPPPLTSSNSPTHMHAWLNVRSLYIYIC